MNVRAENVDLNSTDEPTPLASSVETYWGYIIRCVNCDRSVAILLQWVSAFVGVSLLIAAFGFWTLPGSAVSTDVVGFKLGISSVLGVAGMALVWFASHGTFYEVQIDLARMELREVLRNSRGSARVQNRVKFEDIDAVYIDRTAGENAKARLMLRLDASSQLIELASDFEENLTRLHTRLGRDILGLKAEKCGKENRGFRIAAAKGLITSEAAA